MIPWLDGHFRDAVNNVLTFELLNKKYFNYLVLEELVEFN